VAIKAPFSICECMDLRVASSARAANSLLPPVSTAAEEPDSFAPLPVRGLACCQAGSHRRNAANPHRNLGPEINCRSILPCASNLPFEQTDQSYAASRRVISARAARPSSVNEYGASNSGPFFFTKRFRFRYCMSAFIDSRGIVRTFLTSLMRIAPESRIVESTLRTRSDSTGRRGIAAQRAD
jgi:hypothetical protein